MPITRQEKLLNTLATGVASGVEPITREEQYLAYIAGETATKPDAPITRKEVFLDRVPQGGGGGSGATIKNQDKTITENGTYTADSGYTGLGTVTVNVQASGGTGENKLAKVVDRSVTEITAADLDGATTIGSHAFEDCYYLKSVEIPEGVTMIGMNAFYSAAANLGEISITIPKSLVTTSLDALQVGAKTCRIYITDLDAWCAIEASSNMFSPNVRNSYLYLNGNLVEDLILPSNLTVIGNHWRRYSSLKSVKIPPLVTELGDAFLYCSALETVTFENDSLLTSLNSTFWGCSNLKNITLPNTVVELKNQAFRECKKLTDIVIPQNVTSIGPSFYGCTSLVNVTVKANTPPTISSSAFTNCNALAQIIVPVGCAEAYKAATNWSKYADIIVEEGATE